MISIKLAKQLNEIIVEKSGGLAGIRDEASLSSALNRPFQTFDGDNLYATEVEKAAAIMESIIINHPFVDGNKRMGYAFMRMLLAEEGKDIESSEDKIYEFVISVAEGKMRYPEIKDWIKAHLTK